MHKLVEVGINRYNELKNTIVSHQITSDIEANEYYNDIEKYPHIYVLGCLMDKQIRAERAWLIPFKVCECFNAFEMTKLSSISCEKIEKYFIDERLHRYNKEMAKVFYEAVQQIHNKYNDNASLIWASNPSSATVVYRFLLFKGAGVKIATMATNILVRKYHVEMSDYYSIDISPDIQVRRIFYKLGLTDDEKDINQAIYKARELNPEFPGIIDVACWEIGRDYCHPNNPNCNICPLKTCCKH